MDEHSHRPTANKQTINPENSITNETEFTTVFTMSFFVIGGFKSW